MAAMMSSAKKDGYMMEDTAGWEIPWSNDRDRFWPITFDSVDGFGEGPGAFLRSTGISPEAYSNRGTREHDQPMAELVLDEAQPDELVKRHFKNMKQKEGGTTSSSSIMTALQIMTEEWQMPPSPEDEFRPVEMLLPRDLIDEIDDEKEEEDNDYGEVGQEGDSEPPLPPGPSRIFRLKTLLSTFIDRVYRAFIRMMECIRTAR